MQGLIAVDVVDENKRVGLEVARLEKHPSELTLATPVMNDLCGTTEDLATRTLGQ